MSRNKFLRTCVSCKTVKNKQQLFRFVVINDMIVLDYFYKLDGRGFYICRNPNCFNELSEKKIKVSFRKEIRFKLEKKYILNILELNLLKDILSLVKIANKAGYVVATVNKFIESVKNGKIFKIIFIANDISENSFGKIKSFIKGKNYFNIFQKNQLGEIINKPEVNILGILNSKISENILEKLEIYSIFFKGAYSNGNGKNS